MPCGPASHVDMSWLGIRRWRLRVENVLGQTALTGPLFALSGYPKLETDLRFITLQIGVFRQASETNRPDGRPLGEWSNAVLTKAKRSTRNEKSVPQAGHFPQFSRI
jgi:hypothetical protein